MSAVLEACGVTVFRGTRRIVDHVELSLDARDAVALVGPNAAGKSTLLRGLTGLLPLASGEVRIGGRVLQEWRRDALARTMALVAPEDDGADLLTVRERVAVGRYPHTGPFLPMREGDRRAVQRALDLTGIGLLAERRIGTLSAGERQLAAVARGLAQEPQVLLLDEPAAHLDIGHQLALFRVLDQVRSTGVAVLAVVHDLQRAADWAQRLIVLAEGRIVAAGPPRDVLASAEVLAVFGVGIAEHEVAGRRGPLYSFSEHP
jgi:iron complex transport system ATP-binding protein